MREMSSRETDRACPLFLPSHRLDEIRLYSRALTNDEILELYTGVNSEPVVDAGEDVDIEGEDVSSAVIIGSATDEDVEDSLQYRWLEGDTILLDWTIVENGECPLSLGSLGLGIGSHTFTLEVTDGHHTVPDLMMVTIENSAPNLAPSGGGVYQINSPVTLGGEVSDYDGDRLYYKWLHGDEQIDIGEIQTIAGNVPVALPNVIVSDLALGTHTFTLQVNDSINPIQSKNIIANITDSEAPTLAPVAYKSIPSRVKVSSPTHATIAAGQSHCRQSSPAVNHPATCGPTIYLPTGRSP